MECSNCVTEKSKIKCHQCDTGFCFSCFKKTHDEMKVHHKSALIWEHEFKKSKERESETFRESQQLSVGPTSKTLELRQELKKLNDQEQQLIRDFEIQEQKWIKLTQSLESDYKEKIGQFVGILEENQHKVEEFKKMSEKYQVEDLMEDLNQKFQEQKQAAIENLATQKAILNQKEQVLKQLMDKEKLQTVELQKKDALMGKFKSLVDQQKEEIDLIQTENQKIQVQLNQIKDIFKNKLPQFGIDPNILEQDEEYEDDEDAAEAQEQQQAPRSPSTEEDDS